MSEKKYIKNDEEAILRFKNLYKKFGYKQYKMNKFEEYDLYAENKNFLLNSNIITFTDLNGKQLVMLGFGISTFTPASYQRHRL